MPSEKHQVYRDGRVHVQAEVCETCIFRPRNRMQLKPGRVKEMVRQTAAEDGAIPCHDTLERPADALVCRGFFDKYPPPTLRLATQMGLIEEVRRAPS